MEKLSKRVEGQIKEIASLRQANVKVGVCWWCKGHEECEEKEGTPNHKVQTGGRNHTSRPV